MEEEQNSRKVRKSRKSEVASPNLPAGRQGSEEEQRPPTATLQPPTKKKEPPAATLQPPTEKETPTANPQPQPMEVHHHPDLNHNPKPWKEYILEGLMIFLAVTMGFFAETIREGISDRSKGQEYIRSFVQDLKSDTASFSFLIKFDEKKVAVLNSMSPCFDTIKNGGGTAACLAPLVRISAYNHNLSFTDGTMQQLKNAGGFRLLNKSDKDSIVAYDHAVKAYQNFETTLFQERQDIIRAMTVKLLNFKADAALFPDTGKGRVEAPLLFSNDKALINEFFNDLLLYRRVNRSQAIMLSKLKDQAIRLIKYFDNKYDLE